MGNPYPSLDTNGWIIDPASRLVAVFNTYYTTSYSQSVEHYGTLKSLPATIARNPRDRRLLGSNVTEDLNALFSAYFDSVDVNVTTEELKTNGVTNGIINIIVSVSVQEGAGVYKLAKVLSVENNKIIQVSDV